MAVTATDTEQRNDKLLEQQVAEWIKCKRSFLYFLTTYVFIQDRSIPPRTVKWESWEYLVWLAKQFVSNKHLIIGKARQLGISWLASSYALWMAKFYENAKVLLVSQGEEEAFALVDKCKFIDNKLPDSLHENRDPDQRGFIGFPSITSEIKALASTEKAGRSTDATVIICDEWEYHPYAEINFGALRPTISGGGQFIGLSTANPLISHDKSFFKTMYLRAKSGTSDFMPIFLPWHIRPGRDQDWYDRETMDFPSWQKQGEYPATEDDMLSTLKTRKFFDIDAISQMYQDVKEPISHELSDKYKGLVRIFKPPVIGKRYCVFADPSDGKEDPHAIIVIDHQTGEEVAESHGKTTADLCAQIHDELVRLYNKAFNSYELNARAGGIFSVKIKELDTPNQCAFLKADGKLDDKKTGWWTSKTQWNTVIWGLEEAVRLRQFVPYSKELLDEFNQFMVPEGEDPQKPRGGSDDYIDAASRAWHLRKYIKAGDVKVTHLQYKG